MSERGAGAKVDLDKVHKSMKDLHSSVYLCSETQERFMWVCPPDLTQRILDHYNKRYDLNNVSKGAQASVIGKITKDTKYIVKEIGGGDWQTPATLRSAPHSMSR